MAEVKASRVTGNETKKESMRAIKDFKLVVEDGMYTTYTHKIITFQDTNGNFRYQFELAGHIYENIGKSGGYQDSNDAHYQAVLDMEKLVKSLTAFYKRADKAITPEYKRELRDRKNGLIK